MHPLIRLLVGYAFLFGVAVVVRADEPHRSPVDLVLLEGELAVSANATSNSASLVDLKLGKVQDEIAIGNQPGAISLCLDGRHVAVTARRDDKLVLLEVAEKRLQKLAEISLPGEPLGLAVSNDGATAYVALTALDEVAVVDLAQKRVLANIEVGRWPRYLALSPDGSRLAVGVSGDRGISLVDTSSRELLRTDQFVGLNIGHLQSDRNGRVYFPWMVYRRNPITQGNIRQGWVLASRIGRLDTESKSRREAISLDPPGEAIADPHGLALFHDETHVVVAASGTQELLVYRIADLPFRARGGEDHIDPALQQNRESFQRIPLGGRPMGVRISQNDRYAYVASYLHDSLQEVDLKTRKLVRSIPLGGPAALSAERRGEAIFLDGRRSLDQWYSCHSCHYEGGGNSVTMDTFNDGSSFTFKTVPSLAGVDQTGPWTWHGWQQDLDEAISRSLTQTMLGPRPSGGDIADLKAYLKTIPSPPNPHRPRDGELAELVQKGRELFHGSKAGCANCHTGDHYTDGEIHDVGLGYPSDRYRGFNTPSLLGVYRKTLLLHEGQAKSLEELLTGPHSPEKVSGSKPLTEEERQALIAFLKTL